MSSSPTDLQPVFETILANATCLCGTRNAGLYRFDGELLHFAAGHNLSPEMIARQQSNPVRPGEGKRQPTGGSGTTNYSCAGRSCRC